jgi:uncharacterized coiled-coil protein SlyX
MKTRARAAARRIRDRFRSIPSGTRQALEQRIARQDRDIKALRRKIVELEAEIDETRRLQQRVAELTDAVAEILVPAVDRDDVRVQKALETFAKTSF